MRHSPIKRRAVLRATKPQKAGQGALRATTIKPSGKRLRQSRSTPPATAVERARWDAMLELGCLCCRLNRARGLARASFARSRPELEIHHLMDCGRRRGHEATICLCRFHHSGQWLPYPGAGYKAQAERFGPSYGREKRRFREVYGDDDRLLANQNALLRRGRHE